MNIRTIADMNACIVANLWRIPTHVEVVAGIPRSGLLAANMVALHLNLPLTDIEGLEQGRLFRHGKRPLRNGEDPALLDSPRHVLIVDDCVSQGAELKKTRERLERAQLGHTFTFLSVYAFPGGVHRADLTFEAVPRPMIFEWSFLHSEGMRHVCLDIDGILCVDPTRDEDDDGENYRRFLGEARPLFLPTAPARALVTARLEKYRGETEAWLERHGVRYQELFMMDYPDRRARQRAGRQAQFKAEIYKRTGAMLFVESNPGLAREIAQLSGRPVFALTTNQVMEPSIGERLRVRWQRGVWWGRRLRRAPGKLLQLARDRRGGGAPA